MDSKIGGVTIYVKKLWTLNPRGFKFISVDKALEDYSRYLFTVHDFKKQENAKTFKEWLRTEI